MAEITATNVAKLREMTGVGMMKCKAALVEAQGNMDVAVDLLRKAGAAGAETKATREAREGVIAQFIAPGGKSGVLVEVNCETISWPATMRSASSRTILPGKSPPMRT